MAYLTYKSLLNNLTNTHWKKAFLINMNAPDCSGSSQQDFSVLNNGKQRLHKVENVLRYIPAC